MMDDQRFSPLDKQMKINFPTHPNLIDKLNFLLNQYTMTFINLQIP
jgi:hypothetical protein